MKISYKGHSAVEGLIELAKSIKTDKGITAAAAVAQATKGYSVYPTVINFMVKEVGGKATKTTKAVKKSAKVRVGKAVVVEQEQEEIAEATVDFSIDDRFEVFANMVRMVGSKVSPSLVVSGTGGLGKTYTVTKVLKEMGLRFAEDEFDTTAEVIKISGHSTARGLYNSLYDNNGKIIIFDDCDNVLKDQVAANILKGALDSYDKRVICWSSAAFGAAKDERPSRFEFTGVCIFISNMSRDKIPQPILSRSLNVDLSMTKPEMVERMSRILPEVETHIDFTVRAAALNFIGQNLNIVRTLTLRTLCQVIRIAAVGGNWEKTAKYALASM